MPSPADPPSRLSHDYLARPSRPPNQACCCTDGYRLGRSALTNFTRRLQLNEYAALASRIRFPNRKRRGATWLGRPFLSKVNGGRFSIHQQEAAPFEVVRYVTAPS